MKRFEYAAPDEVAEVVDLLGEHGPDAKLLAGGQSLVIMLQYRLVAPKLLINLKGIQDLAHITPEDGGLSIGSMTTYANVAASDQVRASAPALAEAAGSVGSLHIRNLGTVGGSLCHADPAGDVPAALLALDAMISVDGPRGPRSVAAADWFLGLFEVALEPDELVTRVFVPTAATGTTHGYRRFSYRDGEFPMAIAAAVLGWRGDECTRARVSMGGIASHPRRLEEVEAQLEGTAVEADDIEQAAAIVAGLAEPNADVRGSSEWKTKVAAEYMRRALFAAKETANG